MGIKTPPEYQHPSKRKRQGSGSEPPATAQTEAPVTPLRKNEGDGRGRKVSSQKETLSQSDSTLIVRVVAYVPNPGELTKYDEMIRGGVASKDALLGLLRNARHKIDDLVKRSSKQVDSLTYESSTGFVETNWSLSSDIAAQLKSLFDPFGILTPRALGAKIGAAIIVLSEKE